MLEASFVGLNILDAWLTSKGLALGVTEFNPIMASFGDSMLWKGFLAAIIVISLRLWGKENLLLPLCICMFGVVVWNLVTYFAASVLIWAQVS